MPPRGIWGASGPAAWFLAAAWLAGHDRGRRRIRARGGEELVLRYLAAYGPASVNDIQAWSGLTRLREVTDGLAGRLRTFTGPDGGDLLDLPDAPRPDEESTPAPPRFLPEYDNLLLSFADRSRVIPHGRPVPLPPGNGASAGTLLVDGFWQADWKITRGRDRAVLDVQPFTRLGGSHRRDRRRGRPPAGVRGARGGRRAVCGVLARGDDPGSSGPGGKPAPRPHRDGRGLR